MEVSRLTLGKVAPKTGHPGNAEFDVVCCQVHMILFSSRSNRRSFDSSAKHPVDEDPSMGTPVADSLKMTSVV
jgi:hypothetical protein